MNNYKLFVNGFYGPLLFFNCLLPLLSEKRIMLVIGAMIVMIVIIVILLV